VGEVKGVMSWELKLRVGERGAEGIEGASFLIAGGLYSVTALRENDHERVTVYTKHRLTLQALVTQALGS